MRLYVSAEALLAANQANEKKYKKELQAMIDAAMYLIIEAAKQGHYTVEFDTETNDAQLVEAFQHSINSIGYGYTNGRITWGA